MLITKALFGLSAIKFWERGQELLCSGRTGKLYFHSFSQHYHISIDVPIQRSAGKSLADGNPDAGRLPPRWLCLSEARLYSGVVIRRSALLPVNAWRLREAIVGHAESSRCAALHATPGFQCATRARAEKSMKRQRSVLLLGEAV
jgi:hypothetical protein